TVSTRRLRRWLCVCSSPEASLGEARHPVTLEEADHFASDFSWRHEHTLREELLEHAHPREVFLRRRPGGRLHRGVDDARLVTQDRDVADGADALGGVELGGECRADEAERGLAAAVRAQAGKGANRGA